MWIPINRECIICVHFQIQYFYSPEGPNLSIESQGQLVPSHSFQTSSILAEKAPIRRR